MDGEAQHRELTALDWIGVVVASLGAVFCLLFPFVWAPAFKAMFADFGSTQLPRITELGLTTWFPIALALIPLSALAVALFRQATLGKRRGLIVGAFVLSLISSGICLYAMYAPIFEIAEAVR